ncbi:hypothetical protein Vafri_152 [Volvox africanus]|nr:hypothetical protein Vafri_152 [Volvox africanus]
MANITQLFARILPAFLLGPHFLMHKDIATNNISTVDVDTVVMGYATFVQEAVTKEACRGDLQLNSSGGSAENHDNKLEATTREGTSPEGSSDAVEELDTELLPASGKRPDLLTTAELGIGGLFFIAVTLMYMAITYFCSQGSRSPGSSATTCLKKNDPHSKQLTQRLLTLQNLAQKQAQLQLQLSDELKQLAEELSPL